jgi:tetratricopeptide (TPR) repeat protein
MSEVSQQEFDKLLNLFQKKNYQLGETATRNLLATDSKNVVLLNFLGLFLSNQKKNQEAVIVFKKAIKINPAFIDVYNNLALILKEDDSLVEAENLYKKALELFPEHPELNNNYGVLLKQFKKFSDSIKYYKNAIKFKENYFECYNNLGTVYEKLGGYEEAIVCFKKSIEIQPNYVEAYNNLGNIYAERQDYINAENYYKKAINLDPKYTDALHNLGNIYLKTFKLEESSKILHLVISLDDSFSEYWNTLGLLYYHKQDFFEAEKNFSKSIDLDSNNFKAIFNLGVLYIRLGKYKQGWLSREKARMNDLFKSAIKDKFWDGKKIKGTLLIRREQGVGDEISFISMFYDIRNFADNFILQIDNRIIGLVQRFCNKIKFNNVKFIPWYPKNNEKNDLIEGVNFQKDILLGSLGCFIRSDQSFFLKSYNPYLEADFSKRTNFRKHLNKNKKVKIGISWKTSNKNEFHRNIEFSNLKRILFNKNYEFYNLQFGDYDEDIEFCYKKYGIKIHKFDFDYQNDFESLAALISELNLVITVQNTIAHLSCALGVQTHVLLSIFPRFNWGVSGKTCDWYSSAIIYRQQKYGDWKKIENDLILNLEKPKKRSQ